MKITKLFLLSLIPATSVGLAGCSNSKYLPKNTLLFSGSHLLGFVEEFNPANYQKYNTLKIPSFCNDIKSAAFVSSNSRGELYTTIPGYITTLEFEKNTRVRLGEQCFNLSPFKKMVISENVTLTGSYFYGCNSLCEIDWYLKDLDAPIQLSVFEGIANKGVIKSLNKNIKSQDILSKLQAEGYCSNWIAK